MNNATALIEIKGQERELFFGMLAAEYFMANTLVMEEGSTWGITDGSLLIYAGLYNAGFRKGTWLKDKVQFEDVYEEVEALVKTPEGEKKIEAIVKIFLDSQGFQDAKDMVKRKLEEGEPVKKKNPSTGSKSKKQPSVS